MNMLGSTDGRETSATRAAYLSVRDMILTGALPAGKKLKIEELRTRLKTGASPIREALSLLTSDLLVERVDQRGFRTTPMSRANFAEILKLRSALETMALRQSIDLATDEWEEELVLAHHRMKRLTDTDGFEDAHKKFHMALLSNAASPMLERYCRQLYDLNIRYRNLAAGVESYQRRDIPAEHKEIFEAAVNRDGDATAKALLEHYSMTGEYLASRLTDI